MFKGKATTQLKVDIVFQILHYILTNGKEPTPFHVIVAQPVHTLTALCQHGVRVRCVGNTVRRIDVDLAEPVITTVGATRVPLPEFLKQQVH